MPWVKAAELLPADGAEVLVYVEGRARMEPGRYAGGRWYIEDTRGGRLAEVEGVTHWAPLLDSETYDAGDD